MGSCPCLYYKLPDEEEHKFLSLPRSIRNYVAFALLLKYNAYTKGFLYLSMADFVESLGICDCHKVSISVYGTRIFISLFASCTSDLSSLRM